MEKISEHKCSICGYDVTLLLSKDYFQMNFYQESNPFTHYTTIFDKTYKKATNLAACKIILDTFRNFKKFYDYIIDYEQDHRRVNISNAGYVVITYFTTKTLTNNTKAVKIQFEGRKLINKQELQKQQQIKQDILDIRVQNAYLKQKLAKLCKIYEEQTKQIISLKTKLLQRKYHYLNDIKQDAKQLCRYSKQDNNFLYSKKINLHELNSTIKNLKMQIHDILQHLATNQNQIPEITKQSFMFEDVDDQQLQKYGFKHWVVIDRNNRYIDGNYQIQGNTLRKIGIYGSYQILGRDPFPPTGKHYFSVYIQNVSFSIFSVGIACQSRRNYNYSHDHKDCIAYFAKNGCIWEQGFQRGGGPTVPNQVELRIVVDFIKKIIKWFQDGKQIGSTMIGENFLSNRVVPYIQLNYPENKVIFNERPKMRQKQLKQK